MIRNDIKIKIGQSFIYGQTEHTVQKKIIKTKKGNGQEIQWDRNALEVILLYPDYYE